MKLPWIAILVAGTLVVIVIILFNSVSSGPKHFGAPKIEKLVDLDGTETEVAFAPDGTRGIAVASGDLWLFNPGDGSRRRLTETAEPETSPAFTPDGQHVTFTRGSDTFEISTVEDLPPTLFRKDATSLSFSGTNRQTFVRGRALWITDAGGDVEHTVVDADENADIRIRSPRFSPDSLQIAYVKTSLGLQGEVWVLDVTNDKTRDLVSDRWAENPLDVGWLEGGKKLAYLSNRSGAIAVWYVDFESNTINPLTPTLNTRVLDRIGMAVWQDKIVVPRHDLDSNIVLSDGTTVAGTKDLEFEPAASRDSSLVAYTLQRDTKTEIWTVGLHGENPMLRTLGSQPRFSPNGFELVYTHTDLLGAVDLWKVDLRDGSTSAVTDAAEIDFEPDWSPDGRTIAFASNQGGGPMTLWIIPAVGGKRRPLETPGFFPRFSADGRSLLFWNRSALWSSSIDGVGPKAIREAVAGPRPGVMRNKAATISTDSEIQGDRVLWPEFDVLPDGRTLTAPIEIHETALWSVQPTYVD